MREILHIYEPERLVLVWQPPLGHDGPRTRRVVAEIIRTMDMSRCVLRYLVDSGDYMRALDEGFQGYPAFKLAVPEHRVGVMAAFMRRLPPRSREDFSEYLASHNISAGAQLSDFALLAYTNARLPSDGFEMCADFKDAHPPLEIVLEIAGFRHQSPISSNELVLGQAVFFRREPNNSHDKYAVAVYYDGKKIGYVGRVYARALSLWIRDNLEVSGEIVRINGNPSRPLVYLFVRIGEALKEPALAA